MIVRLFGRRVGSQEKKKPPKKERRIEEKKRKRQKKKKKKKKMSCLFDSLAALLVERPELLASSAFVELRDLREPREPNGASVRAAICAARAALAPRAIEVHGIALDEWGAMEAGTTYVRGMRDGGTWGGGIEIAAAATGPSWSTTAVVFGPVGPCGPYGRTAGP